MGDLLSGFTVSQQFKTVKLNLCQSKYHCQHSEKYNTTAANIAELFTTYLDLIVDLFLAICSRKYNHLFETLVESNALRVLHDIK